MNFTDQRVVVITKQASGTADIDPLRGLRSIPRGVRVRSSADEPGTIRVVDGLSGKPDWPKLPQRWKDGEMSNHARRLAFPVLTVPFVAGVWLFGGCATWAQSAGNLPPAAEEPRLAEPGNYYADFNEAQIACHEGSMRACDVIWLSDRILIDSWLGQYGRTCGGRADLRAIRRANLTCAEAFPGNE